MGEWSTLMTLFPVMDDHRATATTYRIEGAYNTVSAGGDYLYWSDLMEAEGQNAIDGFNGDVCIIPPHATGTLLKGEGAGQPTNTYEGMKIDLHGNPITNINGMDIVRCKHMTTSDTPAALQYWSGLYSTTWHALVLDRQYGIQTLRKRWLRMENYSDPVKDLQGATVTARQGHLVAYADACCVISFA
jgi:hypothetical protein